MRQFDYTTVPAELEATPITNLLLSIREHKGRQLALSQVKPELLSSLMEEAKIQSTRSSNGLEGIVTTQKRLKAIMAYSAKPSSRAEEEIARCAVAYSRATRFHSRNAIGHSAVAS